MIELEVDASELVKWGRMLEETPRKSNAAIARTLNAFGDGVARSTTQYIASHTGLDADEIARMIAIKEATPDHLTWEMDVSAIAPPSLDWSRPWAKAPDDAFTQSQLVKIVTMEDDHVCQFCQDAADHSPYTLAETQQMRHGYDGMIGFLHPNCRCLIQPWESTRRLPVTFMGKEAAPPELFTMKQLGQEIAEELHTVIRVTK